jgi:hypothetical protein
MGACHRFSRRHWTKSLSYRSKNRTSSHPRFLASLADEEARKKQFAAKRDVIQRMSREAPEQDEQGETLPLDSIL